MKYQEYNNGLLISSKTAHDLFVENLGRQKIAAQIEQELIARKEEETLMQWANMRRERNDALADQKKGGFRRSARHVVIFDMDSARKSKERHIKADRPRIKLDDIDASMNIDGFRLVPRFSGVHKKLAKLASDFPNLAEATERIAEELTLANLMLPSDFRFNAILLDGAPGVGKTAFSMRIAEMLGIRFEQINAGGLQHAAQITGASSHWNESESSQIFRVLAHGEHAVAVILIDEIDKISSDARYGILPALLSLLEYESAKRFKCESTEIGFDASKLIIIATSNNKAMINEALLSRFTTIDIPEPDAEQRYAIAKRIHADLQKRTNRSDIKIDRNALDILSRSNCDLRELTRVIRSAFSKAVLKGSLVSHPVTTAKDKTGQYKLAPSFVR